jgi:uncharacterized protein YjdB
MKKIILRFLVFVMMFLSMQSVGVKAEQIAPVKTESFISASVGYSTYLVEGGWGSEAYGGGLSGAELGKPIQSIRVFLMDEPSGARILYRAYQVQGGWQNWVENGADSNVPSDLSGVQVKLDNYPNAVVHYQVLVQNKGWSTWKQNGATAGNLVEKIEAIRIKVFEVGVKYETKNTSNWLSVRHNGETIGNEGEQTQSIKVNLENAPSGSRIIYRTHILDGNWSSWSSDGVISGDGALDGIEVKLEGLPSFSVAYQVFMQNIGWSDWVYDGLTAGLINQNSRIESIRIKIVKVKITTNEIIVVEEEEDDFNFDDEEGDGCFYSFLDEDESTVIGIIPAGVTNVRIQLTSDVDVDLEIYDSITYGDNPIILFDSEDSYFDVDSGDPVEGWYPFEDSYLYIEYSGWYGVDDNWGNEYIYIYGTLQNPILIAAYNYEEGTDIEVCYEYGFETVE